MEEDYALKLRPASLQQEALDLVFSSRVLAGNFFIRQPDARSYGNRIRFTEHQPLA